MVPVEYSIRPEIRVAGIASCWGSSKGMGLMVGNAHPTGLELETVVSVAWLA